MSASKMEIPRRVIRPGSTKDFVPAVQHPPTKSAGLGYSILRALGAHERLSKEELAIVAGWSADFGAVNGKVTPDPANLTGQDFVERVGRKWGAHRAAPNAACYPGGRGRRPGYASIYKQVWVEQRWPALCRALR